MDPLSLGLITGGANLLGGIFTGWQSGQNTSANIEAQQQAQAQTMFFNASQANENRDFQQREALKQRDFAAGETALNRSFQEQMSNSAYQRAMADMKNAGLNPMLAYQKGGATTPAGGAASSPIPSGSSASVGTPNMALHNTQSMFAGVGDAVSKAVGSAVQMQTFNKMVDEIANIQADTAKRKAETALTEQQHATEYRETERRGHVAKQEELKVEGVRLSEDEARAVRAMPQWLRDMVVQTGYTGRKVQDTVSAIPLVSSSAKQIRDTFSDRFKGGY